MLKYILDRILVILELMNSNRRKLDEIEKDLERVEGKVDKLAQDLERIEAKIDQYHNAEMALLAEIRELLAPPEPATTLNIVAGPVEEQPT